MATSDAGRTTFYFDRTLAVAERHVFAAGEVVAFTARSPARDSPNEDSAAIIAAGDGALVLTVADGLGAAPAGESASRAALEALAEVVERAAAEGGKLRGAVLDGLEEANRRVATVKRGAATTVAAVGIEAGRARAYHVGDSIVLVAGGRGRLKWQSLPHSPIGYAVEAGLLDEGEALEHDERHIISNFLGSPEMRIDIGPSLELRPRDTLLLATDGLVDNLRLGEILPALSAGSLTAAVATLAGRALSRMAREQHGAPSKPDDLTLIAYRRPR